MKRTYTYEKVERPPLPLTQRLEAVNSICLDILYKRGFHTVSEMEEFLFPSLTNILQHQQALLGSDDATRILLEAEKEKKPVVIYHDYDVDGITAAAVAYSCLQKARIPVRCYCNERAVDGFGICPAGVDNIMRAYPDTKVIMTVDNGISGLEGVKRAKEYGLQVIVTDHHEPDGVLPPADAIVDHKRVDEPPDHDKIACGAGVAWKVMLAFYLERGLDIRPVLETLDLVALGTVADIVPLLGENRVFVKEGLRLINEGKRPFFQAAIEMLGLQTVDTDTIAFKLAPMINAVSRMGEDVAGVVNLLLSEDRNELITGIMGLDSINRERKEETAREIEIALQKIPSDFNGPAIVLRDAQFSEGIIGIIAGQIKDRFGVPAAIFARDKNGDWRGSCRSDGGFPLKQALDQCAEFLVAYGGHDKGAGLTVRAEDFESFQALFTALAEKATSIEQNTEEAEIDIVLPAAAFTEETVRELSILAPYGEGFPKPRFGMTADVVETWYMGAASQHVKYIDRTGLAIIQWNKGELARARRNPPTKFVGSPGLNVFHGLTTVQFISE